MRALMLPALALLLSATGACTVGAGGFVASNDTGALAGGVADSTAPYQIVDLATGGITTRETVPDLATNAAYRQGQMVFRRIESGSVVLGAASGELGAQGDEPRRRAAVDHFYIAVFELTQGQWTILSTRAGIPSTPWTAVAPTGIVTGTGPVYPAWGLSADLVTGMLTKLPGGAHLSLPGGDQWEAAARAGSDRAFWWGDDPDEAAVAGRARVAETGGVVSGPASVGSLAANAAGLYDILGNVWELTSAETIRGGSWSDTVLQARCANRIAIDPSTPHALVGARLVLIP